MATPSPADGDGVADEEVKPFRLLDLPPEIWSNIGKMVIDDIPEVTMTTFRRFPCKDHQAPILRTCRVVRQELRPYFWEAGVKAACIIAELGFLKELLESVGEEDRRAMCGLRVECNDYIRSSYLMSSFRRELGGIDCELTDWRRVPRKRVGFGYDQVWTIKIR